MFQIHIKKHLCVGAGLCVLSSKEVFDQDEDDGLVRLLVAEPPEHLHDTVRGAVRKCPSLAIVVDES